jgi:hypothetical protein
MLRVTRVDENGNVIAGSNSYVTDKLVSISVNPNNETGNNFSVRNGCGCGIASRKFPDTFNFWELSLNSAALEPQLISFMLGANPINDGSNVTGSGLDATWPYFHWVFPSTVWSFGDNTFEEGPAQPTLNGFSQTNGNWGEGPYGDGPPDSEDISEGGFWGTADPLPTAECASQTVTATS